MGTLPSFTTFSAGSILTAAQLNTNVRDAGNFFLSWPVFEGRQTVAQSIPNGTPTGVTYDTNDVDTDTGHSTVTNTTRYTGKTGGRFQLSGGIGFAANATGRRAAQWYRNGSAVNAGSAMMPATAANDCALAARTITVFLNGTTDYIELFAYQESGGALNTFVTGGGQPSLSVRMVGST